MSGIKIDNLFYKLHNGIWIKVDSFKLLPYDDNCVIVEARSLHYGSLKLLKVIKYDMELDFFHMVSRHDDFYITDSDPDEMYCNEKPCPYCGKKQTTDAVMNIKTDPIPVALCRSCGARGPSDGVLSWDDRL